MTYSFLPFNVEISITLESLFVSILFPMNNQKMTAFAWSVILPMTFLPVFLTAQSAYNPNILPLGDKEALMANTGTGGLTSTGAVFYNPGALAQMEGNSFALSGSAYLRFRFEGKPIARIGDTDLEYAGTGLRSIPTSVISVRRMGEWHLAFSFLVPMAFNFEGQQDWDIPIPGGGDLQLKLLQNYQERLFLGGLTAARSLGNGWSAGLTVYAQAYSLTSTIDLRGSLSSNPNVLLQSTLREKLAPINLLLIGGIHKKWERWNLGIRLMSPSIYLFGKGDFYDFTYSNIGSTDRSETDISKTKTRFLTPLDARIGTVYHPNDQWQLALDLSYRFALRYDVFPDEQLGFQENSQGNFRINGGFEYQFRENMAIYGGGSYTPTTLEETDELFGQDYWAVFAGGKLFTKHIETSLGLFYTLGKGEGNLAVGEGTATQLYEYFGIILGTNYRF